MEYALDNADSDPWSSWLASNVHCDYCHDSRYDCSACGQLDLFHQFLDPPTSIGKLVDADAPLLQASTSASCTDDRPPQPLCVAASGSSTSHLPTATNDSKQYSELRTSQEVPPYRRHTKSKAQIKLLKDWFGVYPSPSGPQLSEYAKASGLEKDQVRNWFVNQRRRRPKSSIAVDEPDMKWTKASDPKPSKEILHEPYMDTLPMTAAIPIPGRSSMTSSLRSLPHAPESMLQRWHNSPPDEEPADLEAIKDAMTSCAIPKVNFKSWHFKRPMPATSHVMIVVKGIPRQMEKTIFVQIMLLKGIKRPLRFFYEHRFGEFRGSALAEFVSAEDAAFAISRLDHIVLEGQTISAYFWSDFTPSDPRITSEDATRTAAPDWYRKAPRKPRSNNYFTDALLAPTTFNETDLANYFENRYSHRAARSDSWRSAPSTDGSAVSSAAHSATSSVSMARRKHKFAYRRSDCHQNSMPLLHPRPLNAIDQSYPMDFSISDRPPTPRPPFLRTDPGHLLSEARYSSVLEAGDFRLFDDPEPIEGTESQGLDCYAIFNAEVQLGADEAIRPFQQGHRCLRYHCQFCTKIFNAEEEWREHETLLHQPREEWVCSLVPCMKPTMTDWLCAFCKAKFTDWEIFTKHSCQVCGLVPGSSSTRPTFHDRTDLADHVKHYHQAALTTFMVTKWSRACTGGGGIWLCSTCGASLQGWENRLDHIGGHVNAKMKTKPCKCLKTFKKADVLDDDLEMLSNWSISTKSSGERRNPTTFEDRGMLGTDNGSQSFTHRTEKERKRCGQASTSGQINSDLQSSDTCSIVPVDDINAPQNKPGSFVARARAWITRRVKRL